MREKLPHIAMLAVSVLGATACENQGSGQDPEDIPGITPSVWVTNISGDYLPMSDNPERYDVDAQIGVMPPGAEAVARCLWRALEHAPAVLVGYEGEGETKIEGYVPAEREEDGNPLLEPNADELVWVLPPCDESYGRPDQNQQPLEAAHR